MQEFFTLFNTTKMIKNLVIVESPAKAKTIERFLGSDFVVKSSMGHVRDLSKNKTKEDKSGLGIDIKNDFNPIYEVLEDKKGIIADLKKISKTAEIIAVNEEVCYMPDFLRDEKGNLIEVRYDRIALSQKCC